MNIMALRGVSSCRKVNVRRELLTYQTIVGARGGRNQNGICAPFSASADNEARDTKKTSNWVTQLRQRYSPDRDEAHARKPASKARPPQNRNVGTDKKEDLRKPASKARKPQNRNVDLFVSCLPGLEPFLLSEMKNLNISNKLRRVRGGVEVKTSNVEATIAAYHLWLGTGTHVLWRCGDPFYARHLAALERKVTKLFSQDLPWTQLVLRSKENLDVRVTASKSKLYHTGAIAERVLSGIHQAHVEMREDASTSHRNSETIPLVVRVQHDMVQISIDTSATPLHQRGYRLQTAKAPLREDLAFSLLYAAEWIKDRSHNDEYGSLLDPFCGSGTIAIEGAGMIAGLPPGRLRSSPLTSSSEHWKDMVDKAMAERRDALPIFASDRDLGAIEAAKSNAQRAGVLDQIDFREGSVGSPTPFSVSAPNLLIATNPPHGKRLSKSKDLLPLYYALGNRVREEGAQRAAVIVQDIKLLRKTGLDVNVSFTTKHGGQTVSAVICKDGNK